MIKPKKRPRLSNLGNANLYQNCHGLSKRRCDMPLITINYNFGTDGRSVAQSIAQRFDVALYDDAKLHSIVKKTDKYNSSDYQFDSKAPGFWDRLRGREPQLYLDIMEAGVYDIAQGGEGVIIGHGSQMLLRDFTCAFHVRLLSDLNFRAANLAASQSISRNSAENLIGRYDKNRQTFFRYAFEMDIDDPSLYDLVINMGKMKENTITKVIVDAIESEDIQTCSFDALSKMKRLSLERTVHAELLKNNIDISTLSIDVTESGNTDITGAAVSQEEKDKIPEIVKNINGISQVTVDLNVWTYALV